MERDNRRSRSQWRGCYAFEDIICDGDRGSSPKRTGGLKMGSTYYYYYELDDGTEHYDSCIPFTTSCPYLPGQPVNLLFVPIEVQPLRFRSASMSSMAKGNIKTMNPQDKFLTPKASPPLSFSLPRLNTSSSVLLKKRSERSLSAKSEKSAWSPWTFFGIRLPVLSPSSPFDRRGRSVSSGKPSYGRSKSGTPSLNESGDPRYVRSYPHTRDCSPLSLERSLSRDPSPLPQSVQDGAYIATPLEIPDEIAEDADDDANFATQRRISLAEKSILTQLAPPPTSRCPLVPHRPGMVKDTQKPLPQLPEENMLLSPLPRLRLVPSFADLPRSHFSTSTLASPITSPTESHFSFGSVQSTHSVTSDIDADEDIGCGDEFTYSPMLPESSFGGFSGYNLSDARYTSEQTPQSPLKSAHRVTFGIGNQTYESAANSNFEKMTASQKLVSEMGYLGDMIAGK
ncbi:hypothetical protein BUE80_DR000344 [Diplocarpon rosae]|nr:hypothetical protein BUE80_DR000344 [Diplocarpon rosae]